MSNYDKMLDKFKKHLEEKGAEQVAKEFACFKDDSGVYMPDTSEELTIEQRRLNKVLDNLKALNNEDPDFHEYVSLKFEKVFDEMAGDDFFGTEGQCDPRGDMRDSCYSMDFVQFVDD